MLQVGLLIFCSIQFGIIERVNNNAVIIVLYIKNNTEVTEMAIVALVAPVQISTLFFFSIN